MKPSPSIAASMSPLAKVALFTISATVMTLVGAIMSPRWTYIEPSIAFNATISFQVVIMALLGGAHRLLGAAARRGAADIAVRVPVGAVSKHLDAGDGRGFSADRVCAAVRGSRFVGPDRLAACVANDAGRGDMTAAAHHRPCLRSAALTRAFGGLVAVNDNRSDRKAGRNRRAAGSERLRQDHGAQSDVGPAASGFRNDPFCRKRHCRAAGVSHRASGSGPHISAGARARRHELRRQRPGRVGLSSRAARIRRDEGCRGHAAGTGRARRAKRAARVRNSPISIRSVLSWRVRWR